MHLAEQQARSAVARAYGVRAQTEQTLTLLHHAETSMQASLATGGDVWLEEFERTAADLSQRVATLERAVADSAVQRQRTQLIARLVADRLAALRVWTGTPTRMDRDAAYARRLASTERAVYVSLRHELAMIIAYEETRLASSEARVGRFARLRAVAVPVGLGIGVVGGFGAMLLFTSGISDRVGALADRVQQFVRLGHAPQPTTDADDEIGRLERGVVDASLLLIERERQLRQARDEAEAANRAKNEFLSRMSHELRTPLNSVIGFGQLLEMTLTGADASAARHVVSAGRHLLGLINEILDIAKIEAGHLDMSPEPIALGEVVSEAVALMIPLAQQRRVTISVDPSIGALVVRADRQRLTQVLLNLLSNAVKYNRDGGRVTVNATRGPFQESVPPGETPAPEVRIEIVDTGIGIERDRLARLFTPFDRLGAEHTGVEGTGLGLALSKRLAEAMSGRVDLSSEPDEGTTVRVTLPGAIGADTAVELRSLPAAPLPVPAATVLYIEDNPANVSLVEHLTGLRPGIRLVVAMNAGVGVELAEHHQPDLILLDLHLPDSHGQQLLRTFRSRAATRETPVVVISADATRA